MKIEVGKFYATRDGRKVRIYATDELGEFPVSGAVFDTLEEGTGWDGSNWTLSGVSIYEPDEDLIFEWKEIRKSATVGPGTYFLAFPSWKEYSIQLTNLNYYPDQDQEYLLAECTDWVKVSTSGYFEGTSMDDVRFVPTEEKSSYSLWQGTSFSEGEPLSFQKLQEAINSLADGILILPPGEAIEFLPVPVNPHISQGYLDALRYAMIHGSSEIKVEWDRTQGRIEMCSCGGKLNTHKPECPESKTDEIISANPFYYIEAPPPPMRPYLGKSKKCECGSDSLGSPKHSSYCPKFEEN